MNHFLALSSLLTLLTTINALQCYQTNFTKCATAASRWSITSIWFSFGSPRKKYHKCHIAEPHRCDEGDIACTTLSVTFQDTSHMEIKRCSKKEMCDVTAREVEEEMGKTVNKLACGFCYGDLCNKVSTNLTMKDLTTRCYVTSEECYDRSKFDVSNLTAEELLQFKNRTFYCFKRDFKTQRCNQSQVCLSIPLTIKDGDDRDVLTLKKCSIESESECGWEERKKEIQQFTGRMITEGKCDFCDSHLCNYYTEVVTKSNLPEPKYVYCYSADYKFEKCLTENRNNTRKMFLCLKNMTVELTDKCQDNCGVLNIAFEETALSYQNCGNVISQHCKSKVLTDKIADLVNKTAINTTCEFCNQSKLCNKNSRTKQAKLRGPICYQSDLEKCIKKASLIISRKKMLACVMTINQNISTKACNITQKCTTITLTTVTNEEVHYKTCGTGPAQLCEKALLGIQMENYIGRKLRKVKCEYCESDLCNNIDTSNERQLDITSYEKNIQCFKSIPKLCEDRFLYIPEDQLDNKAIYRETYNCLIEDDSFQSAFCEDFNERTEFCHVPMNKEYFWRFTRQVLKHTKCNLCETDFCNNITVGGKKRSEDTRSSATQLFAESISIILNVFTVIYNILWCI